MSLPYGPSAKAPLPWSLCNGSSSMALLPCPPTKLPSQMLIAVTPSAISLPRNASLYRTWHLGLPDAKRALQLTRALQSSPEPLFASFPSPDRRQAELTLDTAAEFQKAQLDFLDRGIWNKSLDAGDGEWYEKNKSERRALRLDPTLAGKRMLLSGFQIFVPRQEIRQWATHGILGREEMGVPGVETGLLVGPEGVARIAP